MQKSLKVTAFFALTLSLQLSRDYHVVLMRSSFNLDLNHDMQLP
jgi:hypothetical protein